MVNAHSDNDDHDQYDDYDHDDDNMVWNQKKRKKNYDLNTIKP